RDFHVTGVQTCALPISVVRQLRSSNRTNDTLDLTLFVNGIPVATAELKDPLTGQTVEDAKRQYRKDRDPKELIFARRTLVHFAEIGRASRRERAKVTVW